MSSAPSILWHYTTVDRLQQILIEGELRPVPLGRKIKPAVWFTTNPDWEPTANRVWHAPEGTVRRLSKDQTIVLAGGLARIGVAPQVASVDWKTYKSTSDIPPKVAKQIYDEAVSIGSRPGNWLASFKGVPRDQWLRIEVWENEAWVTKR